MQLINYLNLTEYYYQFKIMKINKQLWLLLLNK